MNNTLNIRDPEDYPEKLKFTLEQITINEIPTVVGSTAYLQHKYPSDVDVFEDVTVSQNKENALKYYAKSFQNIIQKINVNKKLFFTDLKIGEDPRFVYDVSNSTMSDRKKKAYELYRNNLIDDEEYVHLMKHVAENSSDKLKYKMILRKYLVLRWSPEEVLEGKKVLVGDVFITLEKAINVNALIKIDVSSWITNRYLSVEVFFDLKYMENGVTTSFHPMGSYQDSLLKAVEFYSMAENYNPLKVAKRLWSLSRIVDCGNLMQAINPLLGSDPAALNQVVADIETIKLMIENKYNNSYSTDDDEKIFLQILGFQKRVANHSKDTEFVDEQMTKVYKIWEGYHFMEENKKEGEIEESTFDIRKICEMKKLIPILDVLDVHLRSQIFDQSKEFIEELQRQNIVCPTPNKEISFQ